MSNKGKIKMLVGYARVSTQEQNLELQITALQESGCKKIFTEKASGAQRDRPELKAALEYMRPNEGDTLVLWKLDRLARSLRQLIDTVEDLEKQGIGFKSLTESIDTTNSGGRLIFHIFAALSEFERGIIKERTIAGLKAAKDMGKIGGRPPSLMSDDLVAAKALLRDKEITVKEVAKRLKVDPSTLYRHLPGGRSAVKESATSKV
jgi:DNA invertase Pin-like site-specific DNA recombinase